MIYFIQDKKLNHIKIGFTEGDDAQIRLKALQTGSSSSLTVLFTMDGTRGDEKSLHERFSDTRECGEWFRPTPELLQFIIQESGYRAFAAGHESAVPQVRVTRDAQEARKAAFANVWPLRIYLAGKISKGCWRHSIVDELRNGLPDLVSCPSGGMEPIPDWPVLSQSVFGEHHYVGPFFASCDPGCFHGDDSHGLAAQAELPDPETNDHLSTIPARAVVVQRCLEAVCKADLIFAWIDSHDCYGTIAEIGHARAFGKRIWIGGPRPFRDMWFIYEAAEQINLACCHHPSELLKAWLEEVRPISSPPQ